MALQFANKWGCEVHAFTTSDSKEAEAHKLGAHYVHNTKQDGALKKIAGSLDLIISTVNAGLDVPGLLDTLAPKGRLHNVGAVLDPLQVPAFSLILGQNQFRVRLPEVPRPSITCSSSARGIPSPRSLRRSRCRKSTKRWSTSCRQGALSYRFGAIRSWSKFPLGLFPRQTIDQGDSPRSPTKFPRKLTAYASLALRSLTNHPKRWVVNINVS